MRKDFKNKLMQMLKLKHTHLDPFTKQPSMKQALLACKECAKQLADAEALYKKYRRNHPEMFERKEPEYKRSEELEKDYDDLAERVKKDPLYKEHIRKLTSGTEKEKDEEVKKSNEQYYQTHYATEDGTIKKDE